MKELMKNRRPGGNRVRRQILYLITVYNGWQQHITVSVSCKTEAEILGSTDDADTR